MSPSLTVTMLPALEGDAIELRWGPNLAFVDMGRVGTGRRIADRLADEGNPAIELLIVTHVDFDHIGGVLSGLVEDTSPIADIEIGDIWFNGYRHLLPASSTAEIADIEEYGVKHGFELETWLDGSERSWNLAFGHGPVVRARGQPAKKVALADDLNVWIVGPTPERLAAIEPDWKKVIEAETSRPEELPPGLEAYGTEADVFLDDRFDLEDLADTKNESDTVANGTSIAVVIEWYGNWLLLAGDAFPDDLVAGVRSISGAPTHFDLIKLPHHGSKNNVTKPFTDALSADWWGVSTNGNVHHHPDPAAIARIVLSNIERAESLEHPAPIPRLGFNVRSEENEIWDNPDWRNRFGYEAHYGDDDAGLTLTFTPKPS